MGQDGAKLQFRSTLAHRQRHLRTQSPFATFTRSLLMMGCM
jgi:hypothetical protein